ncbi:muscleblind-like protein 3 isoform X2 [Stylophora pistillata]|uniref:muscleblind-like protein 3 isoform X2 n=1 Tax=Stylophora pistillata TaxID=50429 RepID=UPI000C03A819|nr:muscleblind-like protein 3 isoform X2 [Stylophora pistillata]
MNEAFLNRSIQPPTHLPRYLFTDKDTSEGLIPKMIVPVMGKDPRWLLVEVCREFQRGKCSRTEDECRFAHPPAHVLIQNGKVTACFDSLKGRCHREKCKYLHPPKHIKAQMENNGRLLQQQQQQQQQIAIQQQAFAPIAQQMLTNPSFISAWPLSVPASNGTYLQHPVAFLPDASALAQSPSRRLDKSDKLEVCREYQRGSCSREECRFAHPPPHASIDSTDGMITVCMDFMKGRCQREMCRYFHPPAHLQGRVRAAQQQSIPLEGSRKRPHDTLTELTFGEPFKKQTALEVPLVMPGAAAALPSFNQPLGLQFTSLIPTMPLLTPGIPLVQTQVPQWQQQVQPQVLGYMPVESAATPPPPLAPPPTPQTSYQIIDPQPVQSMDVQYWNNYTLTSAPTTPTFVMSPHAM